MRIWIDIATPPQVLFFRPIMAEMKRRGHELLITTRDFSQTIGMADRLGFEHTPIGHHGGKSLSGKSWAITRRIFDLIGFVRGKGVDLAVSHNSYAQVVAGRVLALPTITLMDFEGQPANYVAFRLAHRVIVPEVFPQKALRRYGAAEDRVRRYDGIKEDVYLADFVPDPDFPKHLGLPQDQVVVTMRPPATTATYHNFDNPLFEEMLSYCLQSPQVCVVLLPRRGEYTENSHPEEERRLIIPRQAVDGPNLIYHSDVVISAGGTMNREAAVLGTPAYSVYRGKLAAVDQYLIENGWMTLVASTSDIPRVRLEKKTDATKKTARPDLVPTIVDLILEDALHVPQAEHQR